MDDKAGKKATTRNGSASGVRIAAPFYLGVPQNRPPQNKGDFTPE
jgi:hypothetical protein